MSTIPKRVFDWAKETPDSPAHYVFTEGDWTPITWAQYAENISAAGKALLSLGINSGETIAILGFNCTEWVTLHVAAMSIGATPTGLYSTSSPEEIAYIINHSQARLVLVENVEYLEKIKEVREEMPTLAHVVLLKGSAPEEVLDWDTFLAKGAEEEVKSLDFENSLNSLDPDSAAERIYTSGTTGPPKAVVLTHKNIEWTARAAVNYVGITNEDRSISYLPLSHVAEQVFTILGPAVSGNAVYFAESFDNLVPNLQTSRPTIFFGVPRVWEKVHETLSVRLSQATGIRLKLVQWAMSVSRRANRWQDKGIIWDPLLGLQYVLAKILLKKRVKVPLGFDRLRMAFTGAAPISSDVAAFFAGLDIPLNDAYGQTESSGVLTISLPHARKPGSVGRAIPGVELRIADDGEIMAKGPNVFAGYAENEEATNEALNNEWLATGDIGELDTDGFLKITGRKKEIIITAGGENVTPSLIEDVVKANALVSEVCLVGDTMPYLIALITRNEDAAGNLSDDEIYSKIEEHIEAINHQFARSHQIKKFVVLPRQFTEADGELTPTMKMKRSVIHAHYAQEISKVYSED